MKRIWNLTFFIHNVDDTSRYLSLEIIATDKDVKQRILDRMKSVIGRSKKGRHFSVMAIPGTPRRGETFLRAEDIIRSKYHCSNRKTLKINDPEKVLVQGYGPEASKALER